MRTKRRSVIRTATVAAGALAVLSLPVGVAVAADSTTHSIGRTSVLPDNGIAGLAEKAGQLPPAGLAGGAAGAAAVVGLGVVVHRRRQSAQQH